MEQSFELSGVHCMHCVARVKKALEPLCEKVEVTLSPAIAVVTVKEPLKTSMQLSQKQVTIRPRR